MKKAGYSSETFTTNYFSTINKRDDWDRILGEEYKMAPSFLKAFLAFSESLFRYDVFFVSANGFFLGSTNLCFLQAQFLKLAGKKIVLLPYGADSYVYRRIKSCSTVHALLISYPEAAKTQIAIARQVDYWVKYADAVVPAGMGVDGFGRWDVLIPNSLALDIKEWLPSDRSNKANGTDGKVVITHAPNHRGFKGTEFVLDAVKKLQEQGLDVELKLLEKIQNDEVRRILHEETDILVEQLIFSGHGMNAIEGMASGLPTISNLEDENSLLPMRRWSFFSECPLVSANPENLLEVLHKLVTRPQLREDLGRASREYVEKYHDLDSSDYLFSNVIEFIYGRKQSLMNLYHPLLGENPNESLKIKHPLVDNKILD